MIDYRIVFFFFEKKKYTFHLEREDTFANFFLSFFFLFLLPSNFLELSYVYIWNAEAVKDKLESLNGPRQFFTTTRLSATRYRKSFFPLFYSTRSTLFVRGQYFLPSFQGRSLFLKACLLATIHPFLLLSVILH